MAFASQKVDPYGVLRSLVSLYNHAPASEVLQPGTPKKLLSSPMGSQRLKVPASTRNSNKKAFYTLRDIVKELQQETRAGRDYETSQTVHNMHNQLQALQRSFMTLSDALLDELEAVRQERDEMASALSSLRQDVHTRLGSAQRWHDEAHTLLRGAQEQALAAAQQAARDEAGRVRTALEQQHDRRLAELRADLQGRLASSEQVSAEAAHLQGLQLDRLERSLAEQQRSADAELDRVQRSTREAAEVAVHTAVEEARAEMRESFECMAHSMIEESVPGMIDRAVARSLRDATKEAGGLIHKEVTSLKVEINQIRQDSRASSGLTSAVAQSATTLAEDVRQLAEWCRTAETARDASDARIEQLEHAPMVQKQLEQLQDEGCRESLLVQHQLEQPQNKVATAARRQSKHASQLEDIIRALVMDTAALSRHTKSLDSQVVGLQNAAERTQGQLARTAWVFASALGIPSPLGGGSASTSFASP